MRVYFRLRARMVVYIFSYANNPDEGSGFDNPRAVYYLRRITGSSKEIYYESM